MINNSPIFIFPQHVILLVQREKIHNVPSLGVFDLFLGFFSASLN